MTTHVVFGAGAIGLALVDELARHDLPVRVVHRSGTATVPAGVEVVRADASQQAAAARAAVGAAVVYQCVNPPYHRWGEEFPALQHATVAAARDAGARYVTFENVYLYGDTHGVPMTEATPVQPHTRKGKVRAAMAAELARQHDAGEVAVATARASDYFGPRATSQSPFGDRVIGAALRGKPAQVLGDPHQPHSYTFTRDAGRLLAALGTRDDVTGEAWHVPNAPARTTREIIAMIGDRIGRRVKIRSAPPLLLRLLGLVNPTVRELPEMLYEFDQPFVVDGSKAEQRLGIAPTPLPDAISETVAWWQEQASGR